MKKRNKFLSVALALCSVFSLAFGGCEDGDTQREKHNKYTCRIKFYVHPEGREEGEGSDEDYFESNGGYSEHVMDNMVKLLGSANATPASFTEKLIMEGKNLPKLTYTAGETTPLGVALEEGDAWSWLEPNTVGYEELKTALEEGDRLREIANQHVEELEKIRLLINKYAQERSLYESYLQDEWQDLYIESAVENRSFSESEYGEILADSERVASGVFDTLIYYYNEKSAVEEKRKAESNKWSALWQNYFVPANEAESKALDLWRATDSYKAVFQMYSASLSYSYAEAEIDGGDAHSFAGSFIYADIAVPYGYGFAFACEIRERVKNILPVFVEDNMPIPKGYEGTNCEIINPTDDFV